MEKLEEYMLAMSLGQEIYDVIKKWDYYHKNSVGIKLQSSADSIAAFIAKGSILTKKSSLQGYSHYTKAAIFETKTWLTKAHDRHLVGNAEYEQLAKKLSTVYQLVQKREKQKAK